MFQKRLDKSKDTVSHGLNCLYWCFLMGMDTFQNLYQFLVFFFIDQFEDTGEPSDRHLLDTNKHFSKFFDNFGGKERVESEIVSDKFRFLCDKIDQLFRGLLVVVLELSHSQSIFHTWLSPQFRPGLFIGGDHHKVG